MRLKDLLMEETSNDITKPTADEMSAEDIKRRLNSYIKNDVDPVIAARRLNTDDTPDKTLIKAACFNDHPDLINTIEAIVIKFLQDNNLIVRVRQGGAGPEAK